MKDKLENIIIIWHFLQSTFGKKRSEEQGVCQIGEIETGVGVEQRDVL